MKKVLLFVLALFLIATFAALAGTPKEEEEEVKSTIRREAVSGAKFEQGSLLVPIDKKLKFVFVGKLVHPWYDVVDEGIVQAITDLKKMGIEVEYKWDSPATADISEHVRKIEANISARPDGLAVACLDPATDTQVIDDACNAGLNVVTFDTDAPESLRQCYIGHDSFIEDGIMHADKMAELIGKKGKIGILSGSLGAPNHVAWVKGFKQGIAKYKNIEIVFERPDNDDLQLAVDLTESALQAHPDVKGIFCCNASNPIGAARAVKNAGKAGKIHITGMALMPETIQYIQDGTIDATLEQRQWEEGYWAVMYLVALNMNHTIPEKHPIPAQFYTKDDLERLMK
jgi:ribose transport system substrate-binding protein